MRNIIGHIEFGLKGDKGLFVSDISKYNGHPNSYPVMTFGSARSIAGGIYRHPTPFNFDWAISKIRVMNQIKYESEENSFKMSGNQSLVVHTFLKDVHYQVCGDVLFKDGSTVKTDKLHEDAAAKAEHIFERNMYKPFKSICFGRMECPAFAVKEKFGEGKGYYDNVDEYDLGCMFIQYEYLDDNPYGRRRAWFGHLVMRNGIIEHPDKRDCFYIDFN